MAQKLYSHIEKGKLILLIMAIAETVIYFLYKKGIGDHPMSKMEFFLVTLILATVVITFYQLRIEVKNKSIAAVFGIGLLQFKIQPDEIISVEKDRSLAITGLGIRFTKEGRLYNIQSLDFVRVTFMKKGKKKVVKYGTDDADGLLAAIKSEFNLA